MSKLYKRIGNWYFLYRQSILKLFFSPTRIYKVADNWLLFLFVFDLIMFTLKVPRSSCFLLDNVRNISAQWIKLQYPTSLFYLTKLKLTRLEFRKNGLSQLNRAAVIENWLKFLLYAPGGGVSFDHKHTTTRSSPSPASNFIGICNATRSSLQRRRRPMRYGRAANNA